MPSAIEEHRARELAAELFKVPNGAPAALKVINTLADGRTGPLLSAIAEGRALLAKYLPSQKRDFHGRWTSGENYTSDIHRPGLGRPLARRTGAGAVPSEPTAPGSASERTARAAKPVADAQNHIANAIEAMQKLHGYAGGSADHATIDEYLYNLQEVARGLDSNTGGRLSFTKALGPRRS